MTGQLQRRCKLLVVTAAVALGAGLALPGTSWDRAAFKAVVGGFASHPGFLSGNGSHSAPWRLQAFSANSEPDKRQAPVIVSLRDDLDGFFQGSPPTPVDLAVVLSNFHRLGAEKAATAAVLAWEKPDPIGLAALEKSLDRFDSLVMAAPFSRGAVPSPLPPSVRRASIPLSAVHGDTSALPVVNRIPMAGIVLGGENAKAGFSVLESEAGGQLTPLLARWEDRLVFAFPLLVVLDRLNLPTEGVEVHLGGILKLGPAGPVVPIDDYGRLAVPLEPVSAFAEISAEAVIDGGEGTFPKAAPDPVILRDDQSAAEPATRAFSRALPAMVAAIASNESISSFTNYPRLSTGWEFVVLGFLALALTAIGCLAENPRKIAFAALAVAALIAQWLGVGMASVWLPALPILASIAAAALASKLICQPIVMPTAAPEGVALPAAPEGTSEAPPPAKEKKAPMPRAKKNPVESPPAEKPARKTAAKKTAGGKKPARKRRSRKRTRG